MRFPSIPGTRLRAALASPGGIRILAAGFVVTSLWAGATTWYLVFRDELLARFVAQQGAMQYGYEERIGVLRTQIDRAAIERLSASDGVEVRLTELAQRQAAMEKRHAMLSALTGAPTVPEVAAAAAPAAKRPTPSGKPVPSSDALELRSRDEESPEALGRRSARDLPVTIAALEARLDGIAAAQTRSLERIAQRAGHAAQRLRGLVANTGLDAARFERPSAAGLGGPLVPIVIDPFGIAFVEAQRALADEDRMRRVADGLPLRQPLAGSFSQSSQFGPRLDPFTRGLALHTGIDMRADAGDPARATAAGRVVAAEYAGGYGNMVEIDHGHGVTTRYAHLSTVAVQSGQTVEAGSLVGRVGSTGRSTGSHLHYETRIDGEPVDPQRFLRAGTAGR